MSYIRNAQARATRRKSKWNLLTLFGSTFFLLVIVFLFLRGVESIHVWKYPSQPFSANPQGPWVLLSILPLVFAAIPLSMLCANIVCWLLPPARRALNAEAESFVGVDFVAAQKGLLKIAAWVIPFCVAASLFGALHVW